MKIREVLTEKIDLNHARKIDFNIRPTTGLAAGGGEIRSLLIDLNKKRRRLGSGVSAVAWETSPGTVIKAALLSDPWTKDRTIQFLRLAAEHQDNPHFPKIYNAKVYEPTNSDEFYPVAIVQTEYLHSITKDNMHEAVSHLLKRLGFPGDMSDKTKEYTQKGLSKKQAKLSAMKKIAQGLWFYNKDQLQIFDKALAAGQFSVDPKFEEALRLMLPFWKAHRGNDLHSGNWMIRLTPHGPQLVVIDPFIAHLLI